MNGHLEHAIRRLTGIRRRWRAVVASLADAATVAGAQLWVCHVAGGHLPVASGLAVFWLPVALSLLVLPAARRMWRQWNLMYGYSLFLMGPSLFSGTYRIPFFLGEILNLCLVSVATAGMAPGERLRLPKRPRRLDRRHARRRHAPALPSA